MSWEYVRYEAKCTVCGKTGSCTQGSDDWGRSSTTWDGFSAHAPSSAAIARGRASARDMLPQCECGTHLISIGAAIPPEVACAREDLTGVRAKACQPSSTSAPKTERGFAKGVSEKEQAAINEILDQMESRLASGERPRATDPMQMDYQSEYLASSLWRRIKRRVLNRDAHTCQLCGGRGTVVHHRSYAREVMEGKDDALLTTVCDHCHHRVHFTECGARRTAAESEDYLRSLQPQVRPCSSSDA